jgi:hypothetical protein
VVKNLRLLFRHVEEAEGAEAAEVFTTEITEQRE